MEPESSAEHPLRGSSMRRRGALVYLLLLAASHIWIATRPARQDVPRRAVQFELPAMGDLGPLPGRTHRLSALHWPAVGPVRGLPVVMIHGSPGSASNFRDLAGPVAAAGREVFALDLPGFGWSDAWVPSYSILAHAHALVAALDALAVERAHLLSWSMGGGVILHAADLAPERIASLSLVASIGVQEAEGSGSYAFEHFKYALSYALTVLLPELIPHFGAFGPRATRHTFARNFWDSDQRPLRGLMRRLETPTLILHGQHDFLVPSWAAETSHVLLDRSRLVILEGNHFLLFSEPFGQLGATCDELLPFLSRHDRPGAEFERARIDRSTPRALEPFLLPRLAPWWAQLLILAITWWFAPGLAVITCGVLVGNLQLDLPSGLIACALAMSVAHIARRDSRRFAFGSWCRALAWILILSLASAAVGPRIVARLAPAIGGWPAVGATIASLAAVLHLLKRVVPRLHDPGERRDRSAQPDE